MTLTLQQVILGTAVSLGNIVIHATVMIVILRCRAEIKAILPSSRPALSLVVMMVVAISILMAGHFSQILVWSITYALVGAAPSGADYLYFAFVNYTTLGYGDVVPVRRWYLLGPMTAMNGVLLFGWSTAVIFHVLTVEIYNHPLWPDRHAGSDRTGGQDWQSDRSVRQEET
jgi:hypothetical protein